MPSTSGEEQVDVDEAIDVMRTQFGEAYADFRLFRRRANWSITLKALESSSGNPVLVRLTREKFSPDQLGWKSLGDAAADEESLVDYLDLKRLDSPLSTGERLVSIRAYASRVMSDPSATSARDLVPPMSESQAVRKVRQLRSVLEGIARLHRIGLFHGDLRPDNILLRSSGAALLDYASPTPEEFMTSWEKRYRASDMAPSPSADIYSLGRLMWDLFSEDSLPSRRIPRLGMSTDQLRWVAQLSMSRDETDRPSIDELLDMFEDRGTRALLVANKYVGEARRALIRDVNAANHASAPFEAIKYVAESAHAVALLSLRDHFETAIGIGSLERAKTILALLPVDIETSSPHNEPRKGSKDVHAEYVERHQSTIDDQWRRRILRSYLPDDLDSGFANLSELQESKFISSDERLEIEDELDFAAKIRLELLAKTRTLSTDGMARLMSSPGLPVLPSDIDVLRQWGALFAVEDHGQWLFPDFQLDPVSRVPYPVIFEVQRQIPEDESPWTVLSWWNSPHSELDGMSPRDLLDENDSVDRILAALKRTLN